MSYTNIKKKKKYTTLLYHTLKSNLPHVKITKMYSCHINTYSRLKYQYL